MDQDIKTRWVDALRTGRYQQGQGQLRNGDQFCCLGVLCDLLAPDEWRDIATRPGQVHRDDEHTYPSADILSNAGLVDPDEEWISDTVSGLAELNDNGYSFTEIADYIVENL